MKKYLAIDIGATSGRHIVGYKENGKMLINTPAQYKKEFPFLKDADSLALANSQQNLQSAFKNFFENPKTGFPKFKSKKFDKKSYTTNNLSSAQNIKIISQNHFYIISYC